MKRNNQNVWPYKGIVVEFDGPWHFFAPLEENGFQYNAFTLHRHNIIEKVLGYKVINLPYYWNTELPDIELFEPNSSIGHSITYTGVI